MTNFDRRQFLGLGAAAAAAGVTTGCAAGGGTDLAPDLIVVNGNVLTQDDAQPNAEAFGIHGERFVAVGSNSDVRNLAGPNTTVLDAEGRVVGVLIESDSKRPFAGRAAASEAFRARLRD